MNIFSSNLKQYHEFLGLSKKYKNNNKKNFLNLLY